MSSNRAGLSNAGVHKDPNLLIDLYNGAVGAREEARSDLDSFHYRLELV